MIMFLRTLAVSALAIGAATTVVAQSSHKTTHTTEMFKGSRVQSVIGSGTDHSKDAILPDGTINLDPMVTGSLTNSNDGTTSSSQPRMLCDSSPATTGMRSSTFDMSMPCP
jgi:hypothetical protein